MLIQFTVGNFRSFKEPVTLSMVATKIKARDPKVNQDNTIKIDDRLTLLTSVAIYGANASGKSNLVNALVFMKRFVVNSSKESLADEVIEVDPFRLCTETENAPSFFEIVILIDHLIYRYGFEVKKAKVVSEWLFYVPRSAEVCLFIRDETNILPKRPLKSSQAIKKLTRANALFLSVAAQFENEIAKKVVEAIKSIGTISGLNDEGYGGFTIQKFATGTYRDEILQLIRDSDVRINDISTRSGSASEILSENIPLKIRSEIIKKAKEGEQFLKLETHHTRLDNDGIVEGEAIFDLNEESEGTKKMFWMSGPIFDSLQKGKTLVIDEIEARLHTLMTQKIIRLFISPETNPNRAQLIFTTHDTNLLSPKMFRRDQIWFIEVDQHGASHLYSLAEIKINDSRVRNDASYEDDYLKGRYGAIPLLGNLRRVVYDELSQESTQ